MQGNCQPSLVLTWQQEYRGATFERALLRTTERGKCIRGQVIGALGDSPVSANYTILMDGTWKVHSCVVEALCGAVLRRRILTHRGDSWFVDGLPERALEGCDVIDLGMTPSTNTIAISRLSLPVGEEHDVVAAYVDFPTLEVTRSRQAYARKERALYEYRNLDSGFTARLEVDAENVVVSYGSVWRRLASVRTLEADVLSDARQRQFCRALTSAAPSADLAGRSADFDWLIGGWAGLVRDYSNDGMVSVGRGEWWFSWILEGRAMQDVWMVPAPIERHSAVHLNKRYGTTTRRFDLKDDLWHIAWINPVSGRHNELHGRRMYDRIILDGVQDGVPIRWSFVDITLASFRWTGERQMSNGVWQLESEFLLERLGVQL